MPHLPLMQWDYRDQLQATAQQAVNNGGKPEITWYVYDDSGQRVRKVTERQAAAGEVPTRLKERIYIGGFEIYHDYESDGNAVKLERETLHIMDDKQRVALVETRTQGNDDVPEQLIRYQFGSHLGSACLELDDKANVLSYEEYYSYGSTSYQAMDKTIKATAKRYRYTGKERDEESGLYYHGARYYACWLGRWVSCDPKESKNFYAYGKQNPIFWFDPSGKDDRAWYKRAASAVSGTASSVWSDAVEGSQIITKAISRGADTAGSWVQDKAEAGASRLRGSGHPWLAKGVSAAGIVGATVTSTTTEVAGQLLAAGPNAVLALQSSGESIGTGAARIYLAKSSEDRILGTLEILAGAGSGAQAALTFLPAGRPTEPKIPKPGPVPGRVQTRINLAEGTSPGITPLKESGTPVKAGMEHIRSGHTGGTNTQSQFLVEPEKVLSRKDVVRTEPRPLPLGDSVSYVRHADLPTAVGRTSVSTGERLTNAVRVQVDRAGNIITAYPIQGWRAEFNVLLSATGLQVTQRGIEKIPREQPR